MSWFASKLLYNLNFSTIAWIVSIHIIPQCPTNTTPLHISLPLQFLRKLLLRYFYPTHKPPPLPHPEENSSHSQNIIQATQLSTVKLSTANTDCPHQRWTCQLLRKSALLPRPSMLKLVSLLLASGPSHAWPLPPTDNEVMLYRKGGGNRERNGHIPL